MSAYKISLHGADGDVATESCSNFADDDAAIDYAGHIDHRHEIKVWERDRLVAHFAHRREFP